MVYSVFILGEDKFANYEPLSQKHQTLNDLANNVSFLVFYLTMQFPKTRQFAR